jgi:hypothetical protein
MMKIGFTLVFLIVVEHILAFHRPCSILLRHVNYKVSIFPHIGFKQIGNTGTTFFHNGQVPSTARFFKGSSSSPPPKPLTEDDLIRQELEERRKKEEEERARVSGALDDLFGDDEVNVENETDIDPTDSKETTAPIGENINSVDTDGDITPVVPGDDDDTIVSKVKRASTPRKSRKQKKEEKQIVGAPQPFDLIDVKHKAISQPEEPLSVLRDRIRKRKIQEPSSSRVKVVTTLPTNTVENPATIKPSVTVIQQNATEVPRISVKIAKTKRAKSNIERVSGENETEIILPQDGGVSSIGSPFHLPVVSAVDSERSNRSKSSASVKTTVLQEIPKVANVSESATSIVADEKDVVFPTVSLPEPEEEFTDKERERIIEYRELFDHWYDVTCGKDGTTPPSFEDKRIEILAFSLPERERSILYTILREEYQKENDFRNRKIKELRLREIQQKIASLKEDQVGREEQEDIFYELMES